MQTTRPHRKLLVLLSMIIVLFARCDDPAPNKDWEELNTPEAKLATADLGKIKYSIMHKDFRKSFINIDLYVEDTNDISRINADYLTLFNPKKDHYLKIQYFDDKQVAQDFSNSVGRVSDEEGHRMMQHRVKFYEYNPTNHYERFTR